MGGWRRSWVGWAVLGLGLGAGQGAPAGPPATAPAPAPDDDRTFRPTVIVRKGRSQGSGTVIASVPGETLVLTAAHVATAEGEGTLAVELHRYNLGVERALPARGWPVALPAELAAADRAADVAVLRVRGRPALPYVARLAPPGEVPARDAPLTSVGVDGGSRLNSWVSPLRGTAWMIMDPPRGGAGAPAETDPGDAVEIGGRDSARVRGRVGRAPARDDPAGPERPFLVTTRAPEQGRSGGGLYTEGGLLVGVCVGRVEMGQGRGCGVFTSAESVRRLLREADLEAVVRRSEALRLPVTPTRSRAPSGR